MPVYVISEIKQKHDSQFAILEDKNLRGGYRSVATLIERTLIPTDFLKEGMEVFVIETGLKYRLASDLTTWIADNPASDKNYVHTQSIDSITWTITHNLGKIPSPEFFDSTGRVIYGSIRSIDATSCIVDFGSPISGKATFN